MTPTNPLDSHAAIAEQVRTVYSYLRRGAIDQALQVCQQIETWLGQTLPIPDPSADELRGAGYFDLATCYRDAGASTDAERVYRRALAAWQTVVHSQPQRADAHSMLAACWNHLGILYENTGDLDQAADAYMQALIIRTAIGARFADMPENRVYWGGTLCNLGTIASQQGQRAAALAWYDQAIDVLRSVMPTCTCGCQDALVQMYTHVAGAPHWIALAHQFLANTQENRARTVAELPDTAP